MISLRAFNLKCTERLFRVSKVRETLNNWNLLSANRFCRLQNSSMASVSDLNSSKSGTSEPGLAVRDVPNVEDTAKRKCEDHKKGPKTKKVRLKHSERPGYGEDRFDETEYYFENGLRKVRPYHFTFTTYCKGRWINKKLIDVYSNEFRVKPRAEFERCIREGQITVNGEIVPLDYVLHNGDYIANTTHRHELPIIGDPIKIIHESEDLLVVDKPPSIPVHPCGRYRHNSVIFILGKEYGFRDIRNIHRIDRLTSGLLIFARNLKKDRELKVQISTRAVEKEYLCRVEGKFPSDPVVCIQPIAVISYKIGVCRVCPESKECTTKFKLLSYNGKSSVVSCKPVTGRMHQIRVHLQYLGYPIVNDPLYNHVVFGPNKGKNGDIGKSDAQLIEDLIKIHTAEAWLSTSEYSEEFEAEKGINSVASSNIAASVVEKVDPTDNVEGNSEDTRSASLSHTPANTEELDKHLNNGGYKNGASQPNDKINQGLNSQFYDPKCLECVGGSKFRDPTSNDLVMYLHAWKYKGPGWEFETDVPDWAKEDWTKD